MRQKSLSIIIISYNCKDFLISCLNSIKKWQPNYETEIIVVDNNSRDDTVKVIKKLKIKNLKIIKNNRNYGFSKAVNKGIKNSLGERVLLLNPDTIIVKDAINKLVSFSFNKKKNGILGGKVFKFSKSEIQRTYFNKIDIFTSLFEFTNLKKLFPNNTYHKKFFYIGLNENKIRSVYGVSGGFMLINKKVFDQIGFFDENFFLYLEDIDFCCRAKVKKIEILYYPKAIIKHFGGASSKKSKYKINVKAWRNSRNYFFKKHFSKIKASILLTIFFIEDKILDIKHFLFK